MKNHHSEILYKKQTLLACDTNKTTLNVKLKTTKYRHSITTAKKIHKKINKKTQNY